MGEPVLLQGNEAAALAALDAECTFYAGYPITPSSEIAEKMAESLPGRGGVFVQMEDEIASLAACLGASLAGGRTLTATSGPGFSLMQEHIGFAAITEIPCVIIEVMRGGPSTGLPTLPSQGDLMQARWGTHGDHPIIVLAPASVREIYDLTATAFELAERVRTPVIVLYDEVLAHLRERVALPAPRPASPGPRPAFGGGSRFHVTGLVHDTRGFPTTEPAEVAAMHERLQRKLEAAAEALPPCDLLQVDDAEICVVAIGVVARAAEEAVALARARGIRAGLLRPVTLWPFPAAQVRQAASRVRTIVVAEMNLGQMVLEVERAAAGAARIRSCLRADGEPITPEEILAVLSPVAAGR